MRYLTPVMFILVALIWISKTDYEDVGVDRLHYCDMVALWLDDASLGVPETRRRGWPPYQGKCDE